MQGKDSGGVTLGQVKQLGIKGCYRLSLVLPCPFNMPCGVATFIGLLKVCDNAAVWPGHSDLG